MRSLDFHPHMQQQELLKKYTYIYIYVIYLYMLYIYMYVNYVQKINTRVPPSVLARLLHKAQRQYLASVEERGGSKKQKDGTQTSTSTWRLPRKRPEKLHRMLTEASG